MRMYFESPERMCAENSSGVYPYRRFTNLSET